MRSFRTRSWGSQPAKAFFSFSPGNCLRCKKRAKAHTPRPPAARLTYRAGACYSEMAAPKVRRAYRYVQPEALARIARLNLVARSVVEGFIAGLHRSPFRGFSVEFAEHREYRPGDNIKDVDWQVYGRTDRFYVKQYEEETNLKAHILLDTSSSMSYKSDEHGLTKLEYGCYLAACLSYLMIRLDHQSSERAAPTPRDP